MAIADLKMLTLDSSDARRDATLLVGRARLGGRARPGRVRDAHRSRRPGPRLRHPRGPPRSRGGPTSTAASSSTSTWRSTTSTPRRQVRRAGRHAPRRAAGRDLAGAARPERSPVLPHARRPTGADATGRHGRGPRPADARRLPPRGEDGGVEGVVLGFATIVAVIGVGALVAHLGIVDLGAQQVLSRIAFFVASPALLLTTVAEADAHGVLSRSLVATAVGVVVPALTYVGRRVVEVAPRRSASGSSARSRAPTSTPATSACRSRPTCSGTPRWWRRRS